VVTSLTFQVTWSFLSNPVNGETDRQTHRQAVSVWDDCRWYIRIKTRRNARVTQVMSKLSVQYVSRRASSVQDTWNRRLIYSNAFV